LAENLVSIVFAGVGPGTVVMQENIFRKHSEEFRGYGARCMQLTLKWLLYGLERMGEKNKKLKLVRIGESR
jgi:hypothetical protein